MDEQLEDTSKKSVMKRSHELEIIGRIDNKMKEKEKSIKDSKEKDALIKSNSLEVQESSGNK